MAPEIPRFAPGIELPPYTYIPRRSPHPISDPAGHSFGRSPSPPLALVDWQQSVEYCHAVDLFNHGYYWEAHEEWEGLWQVAGRRSPLAQALQGLIKLAAAGVKTAAGSEKGRRRHASRAAELFDQAAAAPAEIQTALRRATGLSLEQLALWSRAAACEGEWISMPEFEQPQQPIETPRCLFAFRLLPGGA
ncbi:DUF309 domain-containing protein [Candidatus Laterigemmans baculatus]|uniref:DUF309 domain-containing protein n=1 Tax=Candidatus Laterigemmans baculatus TaxID=2770505 RepID=UPI0013DAFB60|nr:DUF309 domain-containing protein [Candidatus Laterigemmans baculatus]